MISYVLVSFLDDLDRITALKYIPSDGKKIHNCHLGLRILMVHAEDVLKARLKTIGVTEHRFVLKAAGNLVSRDWRIFDVSFFFSLLFCDNLMCFLIFRLEVLDH